MNILRYAAFTTDVEGGNPAGVVLDASTLSDLDMASIAAQVGFSETAFLTPRAAGGITARYFSPLIEVPFCGHATIAAAVAYAERFGVGGLDLHTKAGLVNVGTGRSPDGHIIATLTSVPPRSVPIAAEELIELLAALDWAPEDLDPSLPPRAAYAGAWHPIIAAGSRRRLADLAYDFDRLAKLMQVMDWATVNLIWQELPSVFHSRNPFPPGGVVEDPATGAAAAALGGYLRELGILDLPATFLVYQGAALGRPGVISVRVPAEADSGIEITGTAVAL